MRLPAVLRTWLSWRGPKPLTLPDVCVKDTGTPKGRGVFAVRAFAAGEVVEACPVMPLRTPYDGLPDDIKKIVFYWEGPAGKFGTQALALGYGSLYNHNNPANMRYEIDRSTLLLRFIAVRDINIGEELTVNYNADGGAAVSDDDWWFKEKNIEPIISAGGGRELRHERARNYKRLMREYKAGGRPLGEGE